MKNPTQVGPSYPVLLLQWRKETTGQSYESIAYKAKISLNATWKTINGRVDPSASTLLKLFTAMGLDRKEALNPDLKRSQFRRAVVEAAR
jgi:DNA-binding phage protein